MKSHARRVFFRFVPLMTLVALALSVPALAQFEVSPDHFDANPSIEKKQTAKPVATKAKTQSAASANAADKKKTNGPAQATVVPISGKTSRENSAATVTSKNSATKTSAAKRKKPVSADKVALASTH